MDQQTTWINALVGGVVTLVLSFTAFSPLLGGGIAGYLQNESPNRGAKVGALSGVIAAVPLVLIVLLGMTFWMAIPVVDSSFHLIPGALELVIIFSIVLTVLGLWFVGLSAVGGYLGAYLRNEHRPPGFEGDASDFDGEVVNRTAE